MNLKSVCYRCGKEAKRTICLHDPIVPVTVLVCKDYPDCWPPPNDSPENGDSPPTKQREGK